jgi:hypothetical protein
MTKPHISVTDFSFGRFRSETGSNEAARGTPWSRFEEEIMGAKTWMLVYANGNVGEALKGGPQLDRDATLQLARSLFPKDKLEPIADGHLSLVYLSSRRRASYWLLSTWSTVLVRFVSQPEVIRSADRKAQNARATLDGSATWPASG